LKILIDMNLSPRWASYLAARGLDAVHWSNLGLASAPDVEIMNYARESDYVVLTHDLDFGAILAVTRGEKPASSRCARMTSAPEAIGSQIIGAIRQMTLELDRGALLTVDSKRTRIRILPLRLKD
jgi:predicted nuclease of predicted toxin-antitoxin system